VIDPALACWLIPIGEQPCHCRHKIGYIDRAGQE